MSQITEADRRDGIRMKVQSLLDRGLRFDKIEISGIVFGSQDGRAVEVKP